MLWARFPGENINTKYYSALDNFIPTDKTFGLRLLWTQNLEIQQTCQIYWGHESNSVVKVWNYVTHTRLKNINTGWYFYKTIVVLQSRILGVLQKSGYKNCQQFNLIRKFMALCFMLIIYSVCENKTKQDQMFNQH